MFRTYRNSQRRKRNCTMCGGTQRVRLGVAKVYIGLMAGEVDEA